MKNSVQVNKNLFYVKAMLDDHLPLYLPMVKGRDYSVWVDSGSKVMFPLLVEAMADAGVRDQDLRFVVQTHSHADHIGCNVQLKQRTGCLIAGHRGFAHWHTDPERLYQEWARSVPELVPDTDDLRAMVYGWFDSAHKIDVFIDEGSEFDLGGGATLRAYSFPGHMTNDIGWFDSSTRTMIIGDAVTNVDWPHFHIHTTVPGYRNTLRKVRDVLRELKVETVFFTHRGPMPASDVEPLIDQASAFLNTLDRCLLQVMASHETVKLDTIWTKVSERVNKTRDFQSLTSIYAHVQDFLVRGLIRETEPRVYTLR